MRSSVTGFTARRSGNSLVVSLQDNLSISAIENMRDNVLSRLQHESANALILDVTAVTIIDSQEFAGVTKTMKMAALMGARPIVAGVNYAVASALVEMDNKLDNVAYVYTVDQALAMIA
jgi:rsbT antagonist protein RsbS